MASHVHQSEFCPMHDASLKRKISYLVSPPSFSRLPLRHLQFIELPYISYSIQMHANISTLSRKLLRYVLLANNFSGKLYSPIDILFYCYYDPSIPPINYVRSSTPHEDLHLIVIHGLYFLL